MSCARASAAARSSVSDEVKELGHIVVAHALLTMAEATEFDDEEHASGRFYFCARVPMVDLLWRLAQPGEREDHEARIAIVAVAAAHLDRSRQYPPSRDTSRQAATIQNEASYTNFG